MVRVRCAFLLACAMMVCCWLGLVFIVFLQGPFPPVGSIRFWCERFLFAKD
jgi:hypothetical protein